jgi:hypothetical protein
MFAEYTRTKKNVGAGIANICGICIIRKKAAKKRRNIKFTVYKSTKKW